MIIMHSVTWYLVPEREESKSKCILLVGNKKIQDEGEQSEDEAGFMKTKNNVGCCGRPQRELSIVMHAFMCAGIYWYPLEIDGLRADSKAASK